MLLRTRLRPRTRRGGQGGLCVGPGPRAPERGPRGESAACGWASGPGEAAAAPGRTLGPRPPFRCHKWVTETISQAVVLISRLPPLLTLQLCKHSGIRC